MLTSQDKTGVKLLANSPVPRSACGIDEGAYLLKLHQADYQERRSGVTLLQVSERSFLILTSLPRHANNRSRRGLCQNSFQNGRTRLSNAHFRCETGVVSLGPSLCGEF